MSVERCRDDFSQVPLLEFILGIILLLKSGPLFAPLPSPEAKQTFHSKISPTSFPLPPLNLFRNFWTELGVLSSSHTYRRVFRSHSSTNLNSIRFLNNSKLHLVVQFPLSQVYSKEFSAKELEFKFRNTFYTQVSRNLLFFDRRADERNPRCARRKRGRGRNTSMNRFSARPRTQ